MNTNNDTYYTTSYLVMWQYPSGLEFFCSRTIKCSLPDVTVKITMECYMYFHDVTICSFTM